LGWKWKLSLAGLACLFVLGVGAIAAWRIKSIDIPGIKDDALPFLSDQPRATTLGQQYQPSSKEQAEGGPSPSGPSGGIAHQGGGATGLSSARDLAVQAAESRFGGTNDSGSTSLVRSKRDPAWLLVTGYFTGGANWAVWLRNEGNAWKIQGSGAGPGDVTRFAPPQVPCDIAAPFAEPAC
jgi:hypothetical protein